MPENPVGGNPRKRRQIRLAMALFQNFVRVMENYAVFDGRASRSEFWWYVPALLIVAFFVGVPALALSFIPYAPYILAYAFVLAIFTPTLAVIVRRLHDTGRSAWWSLGFVVSAIYEPASLLAPPGLDALFWLVYIILLLYNIALIVLMALPGNCGENKYGAAPP